MGGDGRGGGGRGWEGGVEKNGDTVDRSGRQPTHSCILAVQEVTHVWNGSILYQVAHLEQEQKIYSTLH